MTRVILKKMKPIIGEILAEYKNKETNLKQSKLHTKDSKWSEAAIE